MSLLYTLSMVRTQAVLEILKSPSVLVGLGLIFAVGAFYLWLFFQDLARARKLAKGPTANDIEVDGVKIHYERMGSGDTVLLIHGIGANVYTWRLLLPLLAKHHDVISVDLPGFGRSTKDPNRDHGLDSQARTLSLFLDKLGVKKAGLVGSSMGGAIALWMAKLWPERFTQVAALAPAVSSQLMPIELSRIAKLVLPTTSLLINKAFIKTTLKRVVSRHDLITEEMVRQYQRPYIEEPKSINTFIRATAILSDTRLPRALENLPAEVVLIYGAKDKLVPKVVMDQLLKVLPGLTYVEHPTAGHHPMEDEPEWLAHLLVDFFGS